MNNIVITKKSSKLFKVTSEKVVKKKKVTTTHNVKFDGTKYSCDCKGYAFRKSCKHIIAVAEVNEVKSKKVKSKLSSQGKDLGLTADFIFTSILEQFKTKLKEV